MSDDISKFGSQGMWRDVSVNSLPLKYCKGCGEMSQWKYLSFVLKFFQSQFSILRSSLYSLYNNTLYIVQLSLYIYNTKSNAHIFSVTKYISCVLSYLSTNSFEWILKFYLLTLTNWSSFTSWSSELQNMHFNTFSFVHENWNGDPNT
jgi:hypothetical protein